MAKGRVSYFLFLAVRVVDSENRLTWATCTTTGLAVAKGRVPYFLFLLLDVLRAFPGQARPLEMNTTCLPKYTHTCVIESG